MNIECKDGMKEVLIIDYLGRKLKKLKVDSEKLKVDIGDLNRGIYLLSIITTKGEIKNEKLIIE